MLGLFLDQCFYFNSGSATCKTRNLETNSSIAVTATAHHADYILTDQASAVTDVALLQHIAEAFSRKNEWWNPRIVDGRFVADDEAQHRVVYAVPPERVFAFGREHGLTASRFDHSEP